MEICLVFFRCQLYVVILKLICSVKVDFIGFPADSLEVFRSSLFRSSTAMHTRMRGACLGVNAWGSSKVVERCSKVTPKFMVQMMEHVQNMFQNRFTVLFLFLVLKLFEWVLQFIHELFGWFCASRVSSADSVEKHLAGYWDKVSRTHIIWRQLKIRTKTREYICFPPSNNHKSHTSIPASSERICCPFFFGQKRLCKSTTNVS